MASAGDALSAWLAGRLRVSLLGRRPVGGGSIHQAWCLELDPAAGGAHGGRLFAKCTAAAELPLLEAEADGLAALAAAADGDPLVPLPLALDLVGDRAWLVLPWLDLSGGPGPARPAAGAARAGSLGWPGLGRALARLHRRSVDLPTAAGDRPGWFGWHRDNVIGSFPQANGWQQGWDTFFVERRLAPQLEALARGGAALPGSAALLERVPRWLEGHGGPACVVHGDLWSGNAALTPGGSGVLFDPAVHRADREVDLAMARLFGGFPAAFFEAYEEEWPLPAGHRRRVELYNLYHLLNHANLFGGGYRHRAVGSMAALLEHPPC